MKSAFLWLMLAAGVTVLVLGFLQLGPNPSGVSDRLTFEQKASDTLGRQLAREIVPIALEELSEEDLWTSLGIADSKRDELLRAFADRVDSGFLPLGFDDDCRSRFGESFCRVMGEYFGTARGFSASGPRPTRSRSRGGLRFEVSRIPQLQREDIGIMVSRFPEWDRRRVLQFVAEALKTKGCPRNLSIALAREMERFLHEPSLWILFRGVQRHGLECLSLSDPQAEFHFGRAGLLELSQGESVGAIEWLEKALQAEQKREEYRHLYWMQWAQREAGRPQDALAYFNRLKSAFPLSWYTIMASMEREEDPTLLYDRRPLYPDERRSQNLAINEKLSWLMLLVKAEHRSAAKKFGEMFLRRDRAALTPGLQQHLARFFDRYGLHRLQILMLSQMANQDPDKVTAETLRLLFPKPFKEEISAATPHLDTALVVGLARQESSFDPGATSRANAQGLLQILPTTAASVKRTRSGQLYDYSHNIQVGSSYLMKLISSFDGSVERAMAAYNAGQGNVRKWDRRFRFVEDTQLYLDLIPFRETRDYVPAILRNAYWYHRLFPDFSKDLALDSVTKSELLMTQLRTLNSDSNAANPSLGNQNTQRDTN
jgi:soluble lytic murein transglycosylase